MVDKKHYVICDKSTNKIVSRKVFLSKRGAENNLETVADELTYDFFIVKYGKIKGKSLMFVSSNIKWNKSRIKECEDRLIEFPLLSSNVHQYYLEEIEDAKNRIDAMLLKRNMTMAEVLSMDWDRICGEQLNNLCVREVELKVI